MGKKGNGALSAEEIRERILWEATHRGGADWLAPPSEGSEAGPAGPSGGICVFCAGRGCAWCPAA